MWAIISEWLCIQIIVYMNGKHSDMIVQKFAQSYVNYCAIRWLLACMNVVAALVWFSKKFVQSCEMIAQSNCVGIWIDCAMLKHQYEQSTLNIHHVDTHWIWKLLRHDWVNICAIIKWLCIHFVQTVILCNVQRPICTKQSEHPPCSYTSGWNVESINVITDSNL